MKAVTDSLICNLLCRGLVGYRSVFNTETHGTGFMHRSFLSMEPCFCDFFCQVYSSLSKF